jgi:hypothetical protein
MGGRQGRRMGEVMRGKWKEEGWARRKAGE